MPGISVETESSRSLGKKPVKVVLLIHRIGPYHFARAKAAGGIMETTAVEIFKSDEIYGWDLVPGTDGFNRVTLFDNDSQPTGKLIDRLHKVLDDYSPAAVAIPGWADAVALGALQWCVAHRVPAIVMSETTEWDGRRTWLKEWLKRRILRLCAAGLVGGKPHADYLSRLGMKPDGIFLGYDAVDNHYFTVRAENFKNQILDTRVKYGLPEKYFLASARFVQKKNLLNLVRAFAKYRSLVAKTDLWSLVLLGDGPLRSDLVRLVSELGLQSCVLLPGFKQYDELPAYYALAGAFVHASTVEQWGLVVNEAMASGLPVLVSNRCGCAKDLVQEDINGFTFDPNNIDQLSELMVKISVDDFPLGVYGAASSRIIAGWSPDRFAQGLSQAVEVALAAPHPQSNVMDRVLLRLLSRK
jgi:glycosyltransferase involved in cell wall biosynthesis